MVTTFEYVPSYIGEPVFNSQKDTPMPQTLNHFPDDELAAELRRRERSSRNFHDAADDDDELPLPTVNYRQWAEEDRRKARGESHDDTAELRDLQNCQRIGFASNCVGLTPDDDDVLPLPTVNYAEWAREDRAVERARQQKCGCRTNNRYSDDNHPVRLSAVAQALAECED